MKNIEKVNPEEIPKASSGNVSLMALESTLQEAKQLVASLDARIRELKQEEEFPAFRAKYEGRYWKHRYGNNFEGWWRYMYCRKVFSLTEGDFDTFDTDWRGSRTFQTGKLNLFDLCQTEITREEYLEQADIFGEFFRNLTHNPDSPI